MRGEDWLGVKRNTKDINVRGAVGQGGGIGGGKGVPAGIRTMDRNEAKSPRNQLDESESRRHLTIHRHGRKNSPRTGVIIINSVSGNYRALHVRQKGSSWQINVPQHQAQTADLRYPSRR